jgi:hypothetical protein
MIANAGEHIGLSSAAKLFASAARDVADVQTDMDNTIVSMQHVATQNPLGNDPRGTVRAVNLSWTYANPAVPIDGTSTITLGLDWSARVHDVLYVKSMPEQGRGTRAPIDNYNGLNVTASTKNNRGVFDTVWTGALFPIPPDFRRLTDLVAPGVGIMVPPNER